MVITLANENDCLLLVILFFHEFKMNHLVNKNLGFYVSCDWISNQTYF